jgi:hypothetical protein
MKTLFFLLLSFSAFAQDKVYRVHTDSEDSLILLRYSQSKTINVTEGLVYKWVLPAVDTARFFNATDGQYEATVTFKKLGTTDPEPVIETIDNVQMTAANGWTRNGATTSPGWYDNTTAWSALAGATISYTFTGTKVELYAERKDTHGKGQIIIMDGTTEVSSVEVDYSLPPHGLQVIIWASPTLPRKQYTLTLKVNSGTVLADKIVISK